MGLEVHVDRVNNDSDTLGTGGEGEGVLIRAEYSRNVHEELLISIALKLGLVVQSLGPGLLDNCGSGLGKRL